MNGRVDGRPDAQSRPRLAPAATCWRCYSGSPVSIFFSCWHVGASGTHPGRMIPPRKPPTQAECPTMASICRWGEHPIAKGPAHGAAEKASHALIPSAVGLDPISRPVASAYLPNVKSRQHPMFSMRGFACETVAGGNPLAPWGAVQFHRQAMAGSRRKAGNFRTTPNKETK